VKLVLAAGEWLGEARAGLTKESGTAGVVRE
jgi:hypothetical protein